MTQTLITGWQQPQMPLMHVKAMSKNLIDCCAHHASNSLRSRTKAVSLLDSFVTFLATLARPLLNAAKIYLLKLIVDNLALHPTSTIVLIICGGYLAIALAKAGATYIDQYLGAYIGGRMVIDLREQLFHRFLR